MVRLENRRLVEVEMWTDVPYAFSPTLSRRAITSTLLLPASTTYTERADAPWGRQMDADARSPQNRLQGTRRLSLCVRVRRACLEHVPPPSVQQVGAALEDEVRGADVLLLTAVPERKLPEKTTGFFSQETREDKGGGVSPADRKLTPRP